MKKLLFLFCLIPLVLGSCPNPLDAPGEERGGTALAIDFGPGGLRILREDGTDALEAENLIWRDQEPSRLKLKVASGDWTDIRWYLDGAAEPFASGPSLTLEAFRFRETAHTLGFRALYRGLPQAAQIPFTVKARRPADIVWTQTEDDSSLTDFDLAAWTGWGEALESWELGVLEQPKTYFAVTKRPGQTLSPGGEDAARVLQAPPGQTLDGSTAGDTLEVFAVDTSDLLFAGGERNFSLHVTEPGRQESKIVTVKLRVRPRPTGIALFFVENRGLTRSLTRISPQNAADYANPSYAAHREAGTFPPWGQDFADVTNLADAIHWLNAYARGGTDEDSRTEYLIRVEKDEALDKIALHCYGGMRYPESAADYVRVRLQGYGGERVLRHKPDSTLYPYFTKPGADGYDRDLSMGAAFLNVGLYNGGMSNSAISNGLTHVALHLGDSLTVDAGGGTDPTFATSLSPHLRSMISVDKNAALFMEPGSRLINYVNSQLNNSITDSCAVTVYGGGLFEMAGGEIADIQCGVNLVYLYDSSARFVYRGGIFNRNNSNFIAIRRDTLKIYYHLDFKPQG